MFNGMDLLRRLSLTLKLILQKTLTDDTIKSFVVIFLTILDRPAVNWFTFVSGIDSTTGLSKHQCNRPKFRLKNCNPFRYLVTE